MGEGEAGSEVVIGPAAGNSGVQCVVGGVVDYTNQGLAVEGECEGDAEVGEAVDKVDGSGWGVSPCVNGGVWGGLPVNWITDKGGGLGESHARNVGLFSEEAVVGQ